MLSHGANRRSTARARALTKEWRALSNPRWRRKRERDAENLIDCLNAVVKSCKGRAAKRGQRFEISAESVRSLLDAQGWRCAITGLPFKLKARAGRNWWREPYRPSIDRINSNLGYVEGNCRLVCVAVNAALGEWGDEVFWKIVKAAFKNRKAFPANSGGTNREGAGFWQSRFPLG